MYILRLTGIWKYLFSCYKPWRGISVYYIAMRLYRDWVLWDLVISIGRLFNVSRKENRIWFSLHN